MPNQTLSPVELLAAGRRVPELDAVRGVAILMVLVWHYVAMQLPDTPGTAVNMFRQALGMCWSGVDLFFVLSGFLIGGILIQHREAPNYFKAFYLRRACRIFPIYYAWLVLYWVLVQFGLPRLAPNTFAEGTPFWSYLLYCQNILQSRPGIEGSPFLGATWSLAVEEQFYLLFPLFVRWVSPSRLPGYLILVALSATAIRLFFFYFMPKPGVAGYFLLPCRWDALCLGALGAWCVRVPSIVQWIRRNQWFLLGLLGICVLIIGVLRASKQSAFIYAGAHLIGFLTLAVGYLAFILLALFNEQNWVRAITSSHLLQRLGMVSYGLYLFHQPVSWLFHDLLWAQPPRITTIGTLMTTGAALVVSLALAVVSWKFFESKFVAWGRGFTYQPAPV